MKARAIGLSLGLVLGITAPGCDGCDRKETGLETLEAQRDALASEVQAAAAAHPIKGGPVDRAKWSLEACQAGCNEAQKRAVQQLTAAARLVPTFQESDEGEKTLIGLRVFEAPPYSPWSVCGVQVGDLVVAAGEIAPPGAEQVPRVIRACAFGETLVVERGGTRHEVKRKLSQPPADETPGE